MFVCDGTQRRALLWGAMICGLLMAGCARNGRVVTSADWGFLDRRHRTQANEEPSYGEEAGTTVTQNGDPFLNDSADDAPIESEPTAQLVSESADADVPPPVDPVERTVRSLPLASGKVMPVTPWPEEDVPEVRVSANRSALARTLPAEPPATMPLEELQSTLPAPEAIVERMAPAPVEAPVAEESATIAILPEGNLPVAEPPSVVITPLADSVELLASAPSNPIEPPSHVSLVEESTAPLPVVEAPALEETPGPVEDAAETLRPYRRVASPQQVAPQLDARTALTVDDRETGFQPAGDSHRLKTCATATFAGDIEVEPGELLPFPTETLPARMRLPRLPSPGRLPHGVASEAVPDVPQSAPDLLAPVPLESSVWPRLTTASRFGLFIGLTGLAGLLLWRAFERRRFQNAIR